MFADFLLRFWVKVRWLWVGWVLCGEGEQFLDGFGYSVICCEVYWVGEAVKGSRDFPVGDQGGCSCRPRCLPFFGEFLCAPAGGCDR